MLGRFSFRTHRIAHVQLLDLGHCIVSFVETVSSVFTMVSRATKPCAPLAHLTEVILGFVCVVCYMPAQAGLEQTCAEQSGPSASD